MDIEELEELMNEESELKPAQLKSIDAVIKKYPYFQAARAVRLKGLHQNQSFLYNAALRKTAAYTTDRRVLFKYITSAEFQQHFISNRIKKRRKAEKNVDEGADFQQAIEMDEKEADQVLDPEVFKKTTKEPQEKASVEDKSIAKTVIDENKHQSDSDKPVQFDKNQSRSFSDWLKLTSAKPIARKKESEKPEKPKKRSSKEDLIIDRFIEKTPKIVPPSKWEHSVSVGDYQPDNQLMTETLAEVYAKQKNYNKAIQAYKILILKNPEKSGLFANRVEEIERLRENKSK